MSLKEDLTVLFVSFYSKNIIEKPIGQIDREIPIIVVENSQDLKLKEHLEKKYPNVKVVIPDYNSGNGGGANIALNLVKSKYALYLDVDVSLTKSSLEELYNSANELKNFSIIGPSIDGLKYKKNYFIEKNVIDQVHSMNFITGCALFFNMNVLNQIGNFDENIFLYYEENDLYVRSLKKNFKIYLNEKAKIKHIGNVSTDLLNKEEIEINRNWHLMWSNFYFHKKHYGIFFAYYKSIFKLITACFKFSYFFLLRKEIKKRIYLARLSGILNAMQGKKSWHRTKIE